MNMLERNGTILFSEIDDRLTSQQIREALFVACSSFGPVLRVSSNRKALRGKAFVVFLCFPDAVACAARLHGTSFLSASLNAQIV
ncbi:putative U2 small nuclear ribonucleoprotein B [Giardia duodenalis]|uniref:U2 small nuclear ribonucleoprotein B n=2 Tax=Giardia intestinalis TaxID=5741 RepID=A8BM87_GIAIC|nr:putative U2 small nuclear ribonucleoprotein B [Giardia intestinalis]ESU38306.1 Putative RNA binding or ribonucleoprotein domain protein [Giardia intestinalis]KAE8303973.1 putative U2 small nuclear ribonucleoprotein B [Giardia intestinalis]|eukprot:XP_001706049.1 U2 small nuclear ribonucleoprotein B, putative [Giardia lamblia ATCC 50803]